MDSRAHFSGSYRPDDVRFLLEPIRVEPISIVDKERLIQSGQRHYSELLSPESLPSAQYMEVFRHAFAMARIRMAEGLLDLAAIIATRRPDEITLVSLARAGTPVGVILKHILERVFARPTAHYSISIIRDRGIDRNAIRFILGEASRAPAGILFVDGWTGKGVIARELRKAMDDFARSDGVRLDSDLFTLADLAGVGIAPSDDDYLIPSSILNATMSGLISRSILNEQTGPDDFHGCVFYRQFAHRDLSIWFVDSLLEDIQNRLSAGYTPNPTPVDPARGQERARVMLADIRARFGITDENFIKPGIGEATRVLLRRVPERVLVRDPHAQETGHLLQLAQEKQVYWEVDPALPYQAISIIKGIPDA